MNITEQLQKGFDAYYPDGPTDLEYLRFYANLAVRALYYADGQGVLNEDVLSALLDKSYGAEQRIKKEQEEENNAND